MSDQQLAEIEIDEETMEKFMQIPGGTDTRVRTAISSYYELEEIKERHYAEVQRLKARITQLEQELSAMKGAELPAKTTQGRLKPAAGRVKALDYATMPSALLRVNQGPGSTPEKLRRAMAAMIAYNSIQPPEKRYKLSAANLRKVSGCRHTSVVAWMAENRDEIDAYNAANGLTGTQADRGKTSIEIPIAQGLLKW